MNQGSRLQSVIGTLIAQLLACHTVQLFINQRQKVFKRLLVAGAPSSDQIARSLVVHAPGRPTVTSSK
jgi:hypothetical protein